MDHVIDKISCYRIKRKEMRNPRNSILVKINPFNPYNELFLKKIPAFPCPFCQSWVVKILLC